jgi:hypothetical protein
MVAAAAPSAPHQRSECEDLRTQVVQREAAALISRYLNAAGFQIP